MKIAIFSHPDCLMHDTGPLHPENPARLTAIMDGLKSCDFINKLDFISAPLGTREQILLVHTAKYLELVERSIPADESLAHLDSDTVMSNGSFQAALRAVGSGCQAVDDVMHDKYKSAFCAVRPPGHHATPDRAMGFCIFNNIAIAARHAMQKYNLKRVAIVDFDVHHGNGTQAAFEQDARVLYISTHQWPHYPGTGKPDEKGVDNILNLVLPAGTDGETYRTIFSENIIPALHNFQPQLILASAGFDAHKNDPLASIKLTEEDYKWIGHQLYGIANECCGGKVVSMLEGGYNLQALAESTKSYIAAYSLN